MAYVLQASSLARKDRAAAVETLAGCGRDLIVIDVSYQGDGKTRWT